MKIWMDGSVREPHQCAVPVLDHGLLYGDGVFEGIRITQGRVFRLAHHVERLSRSACAIGLHLPLSESEITDVVLETARAHGHREAYVRLIVTRGVGELNLDPLNCFEPRLVCIVAPIKMFDAESSRNGLKLMTAARRRPPLDVLDPQVKSLNYLNNVLSKRQARLAGYDDALVLNQQGRVAEASAANVFCVSDNVLLTPPPVEGALPGITRAAMLQAFQDIGAQVAEQPFGVYDLLNASEAFLSGSGVGLVGVASLDNAQIGDGKRPWLKQAQALYTRIAERDGVPC